MNQVVAVYEVWMKLWNDKPEKVTVVSSLNPDDSIAPWQISKGFQVLTQPK